jgi:hypothetical protein
MYYGVSVEDSDSLAIKIDLLSEKRGREDFSFVYLLSEGFFSISNSDEGGITITEGRGAGTSPVYHNYYRFDTQVRNWMLVKSILYQKRMSGTGVLVPEVEVRWEEGTRTLDGETIPGDAVDVDYRLKRCAELKQEFGTLHRRLKHAYKAKDFNGILPQAYSTLRMAEIITCNPVSPENVENYNNFAFYLSFNEQTLLASGYILTQVIEKVPNRTVAFINLGDVYRKLDNGAKAAEYYERYMLLMKREGKEKRIPPRIRSFDALE